MKGTGQILLQTIFLFDYEDFLKIDDLNAGNSSKMFLDKIDVLSDTYVPHKRIINRN